MSAELYETTELEDRRDAILQLVAEYHELAFPPPVFVPGVSPVPVSGRVFDATELQFLVDSGLEFWLTAGRYAKAFERDFARFFGMRHAILVNSGSSANLVALSALTSPRLRDRQLRPGDEVITVAAGFPTTVNPIVQNGLDPGLRRRDAADLQHRRVPARRGAQRPHAGHHDRPHARATRSMRSRSRPSPRSTASG